MVHVTATLEGAALLGRRLEGGGLSMRILIAGGGRTGATLALTLHAQKHEVRLMEHRPGVLAHIHRELPTELIYEGNPNDPRTLEFARIADAQVLVASMSSDAENLSLCFIAREHFKVPRTIATINDPRFAWLFGPRFHVDVAVNQADILASLIEQELSVGDMMTLLKLRKGSYSLVSETLVADARAVGRTLRELEFPRNAVVCAILRRNDVVIPRGDVRFEAGDEVLALVDEASAPELAALFGPPGAGSDLESAHPERPSGSQRCRPGDSLGAAGGTSPESPDRPLPSRRATIQADGSATNGADGSADMGPALRPAPWRYQSSRTPSCIWRGSPRPLAIVPSKLKTRFW